MARRRGNPNWGKPMEPAPAIPSEFEMLVEQLRLIPQTYAASVPLRVWCQRNKNRYYIPEWLLKKWGITVDARFDDAA